MTTKTTDAKEPARELAGKAEDTAWQGRRMILDLPQCPTCDAWASALLEPCVKVIPLVQAGEAFIEDDGLADVEPCGDEKDEMRVECPNAHSWTAKVTWEDEGTD